MSEDIASPIPAPEPTATKGAGSIVSPPAWAPAFSPRLDGAVEKEPECQLHELSMGPNPLAGIPTFVNHQFHREHILLHMAAVFRNWARMGYTEGISGHISVRDPEHPDCIWMNPIGKHFGLMNASDMVCLEIDTGKIVGGNRVGRKRSAASMSGFGL